mgnify:FL=1
MLNFNKALNIDSYQTVSTNDLLDLAKAKFSDQLDFSKLTQINGWGSTSVSEVPFRMHSTIGSDQIVPKMLICNSMNREKALTIAMGVFRLVCSNGLVVGDTSMNQRIIHRAGPKVANFLETFEEKVAAAIRNIQKSIGEVVNLTDIKIASPRQAFDHLAAQGVLTTRSHSSLLDQLENDDFRSEDRAHLDNVWGILNLANEALESNRVSRSTPMSLYERNRRIVPSLLKIAA